jgi:proline iminopeptidase
LTDATRLQSVDASLFPACDPIATGTIALDGRHRMHWEACGNERGVPLVFIHGGPGGGSLPHHRRFYDPAFWRIVLYDQRGAGRSSPVADIVDNTTAHLVDDLEKLRAHLAIDRWVLFGGSWGSTLALAYAEAHPERVLGLVLRGIFLASRGEIDWFMNGMRHFFPDAWRAFTEHLAPGERGDLLQSYYKRLTHPDSAIHLPAARAWDRYECACSSLLPRSDGLTRHEDDAAALAIARIEAHYFIHTGFLADGELIDNLARIRHLPCTIVQGRYDVVCPPATADALARAWPEAEFVVVPDAGHSVREPGITRELVAAVKRMQSRFALTRVP